MAHLRRKQRCFMGIEFFSQVRQLIKKIPNHPSLINKNYLVHSVFESNQWRLSLRSHPEESSENVFTPDVIPQARRAFSHSFEGISFLPGLIFKSTFRPMAVSKGRESTSGIFELRRYSFSSICFPKTSSFLPIIYLLISPLYSGIGA
jgi:hypothetical protein